MALLLTTLEDTAHAWVVSASGLAADQVIHSHQDGPDPVGLFITITALEDAHTEGLWPEEFMNDSGVPFTREHWRVAGCIDAYGTGARQLLADFKSKCLLPTHYGLLAAQKIEADPGGLTFIPAIKSHGWEEHAKLDMVWRLADGSTTDPGTVDPDTDDPIPVAYFDTVSYSGPDMDPHPIPVTGPIEAAD